MIYPSIDLMNGKAVQLVQGDPAQKKIEIEDIFSLAEKWSQIGEINVIDLDAAFGTANHQELIIALAKRFAIRVGGGIRTISIAKAYCEAGAKKVIIGSRMFEKGKINFSFLEELKKVIGKDKVLLALDSKEGKIVIKGWKEKLALEASEVIKVLEPYASGFLYTCVEKEGMMQGTDIATLSSLKKVTTLPLIAAGGISTLEEVHKLEILGIDSVLGMALYTGNIYLGPGEVR